MNNYICKLNDCHKQSPIGNKALSLLSLLKHQCNIPETVVCNFNAYKSFLSNPEETEKAIYNELRNKLNPRKSYAVRSSSNLEDGHTHSYAGLFETVLNVKGIDSLWEAVKSVWKTSDTETVRSYLQRMGLSRNDFSIAVIIQEMIPAEFSGVVFTQNPLTGKNETIIEVIKGTGDNLVQNGFTPFRWRLDKNGVIEEHEQNIVPEEIISIIFEQTNKLSLQLKKPLDLEWCFSKGSLVWLQMREITAIQNTDIYTNHFSKEFLPGTIKPLVWSVSVPQINKAWVKVLTELIGKNDLDYKRLSKSFYFQAYFNTGVLEIIFKKLGLPSKILNMIQSGNTKFSGGISYRPTLKTLRFAPRMIFFLLDKLTIYKRLRLFLNKTQKEVYEIKKNDFSTLSDKKLLEQIDGLLLKTEQLSYYYLVTPFILYFSSYFLRKSIGKKNSLLVSFDGSGMNRLESYDPNIHLSKLNKQFKELAINLRNQIKKASYEDFCLMNGIEDFKSGVNNFLERFGHFSDSGTDFSYKPWKETPTLLLHIISDDQYKTQSPGNQHREIIKTLPLFKKLMFKIILKKVKKIRQYKEKTSYVHTYIYGILRDLFIWLGDSYQKKDFLNKKEDIFYLYFHEIMEIAEGKSACERIRDKIRKRKEDICRYKDMNLPNIIFGEQEPPPELSKKIDFKGIATSRGYCSGYIKVVKGISDYNKMNQGDILVIPYSDIGLAPLFSKAGAVISESGGILSHCSIIAREYKIPAITSVGGACSLEDNTFVIVDGYKGEIKISEEPEEI